MADDLKWASHGTLHFVSCLERNYDGSVDLSWPTDIACVGCATRSSLLDLLASGMTVEEIIEDFPDLERDDLLAALEFAALVSGQRRVVPLGAA